MFKHLLLVTGLLFIAAYTNAQTAKLYRYKDMVFSDVVIDKDLSYVSHPSPADSKSGLFDLYQPKDDHSGPRPLIIWMHGGGFKFGSKDAKGIRLWSESFAKRGYVCAAINYRLSKKHPVFNFGELQKGCYYAVQDVKMAVAYFREHHSEYNIDPDKIILAGNSAGGMTALQAAYSTDAQLAKMAGIVDTAANKPGILKVAGVINFWGAIFNLDWLKNANVPIVSVLGDKDSVVPPTHKSAPLYGGVDIHRQADILGLPNKLKIFEGYSHELQKSFDPIFPAGKGAQKRWLEAGQFAADFLYRAIFK